MGTFDSPNDTPNQIKHEGDTIALTFSPGKPQPGQGTVEWTIPAPMLGCSSESDGAYCGMLVLVSENALTQDHIPVDGMIYEADPQADFDVHAGDKINGALVVGAFYEGEKKSRNEPLTTQFIIQGLKPQTNYYVIGYAVDCQGRYHKDGQRAYSANFGNVTDPGTPANQTVVLNDGNGAFLTDGTGLVPGMLYEFEFEVNTDFPKPNTSRIVKVFADGTDLGTYQDLVNAINKAISTSGNPPQSPVPLNQGRYYWDGTALYQWDGTNNIPSPALIEPADPASISVGDYWFNPSTNSLSVGSGSPVSWMSVDAIHYVEDPTNLTMGDDFWFNGMNAYRYCKETWCLETLTVQSYDPLTKPIPDCSVYWYDETNTELKHWNIDFDHWEQVFAIQWDAPPTSLTAGTYWYNDATDELMVLGSSPNDFESATFIRLNTDPVLQGTPVSDGDLWFNHETEELKIWSSTGSPAGWVDVSVLVWPEDPRDVSSCDLWWDTTTNTLHKWDSIHNEWDQVGEFTQSPADPYSQPILEYGELWLNSSTGEMKRWDGITWNDVTYIDFPVDPTLPVVGTAWHNTVTNSWYVWDGVGWNPFDPIDSDIDPTLITPSALWFDTSTNTLYQRIGASWVTVPFSTTPYYPSHGDQWYDNANNVLMEWVRNPDRTSDPLSNQGSWVEATPIAEAIIDDNGNLTLHTTGTGSTKMIMILIPEGTNYATYEGLATGDAGYDVVCCHYNEFGNVSVPDTTVQPDTFLFSYLTPPGGIIRHQYGDDGVHELPTYEQLGVGDDGSPDERRELIDWVRSQLGYPVVEVELTTKQLNEAIDFALETIRQRTSIAYQRSAFFLDVRPGYQHYKLTDRTCGFHKVVTVMSAHRFTSAFLSTAHGSGVYGQIVLQHLYNMGTFDLLSYHLVSEYVEQLEHLFATRLVFHWNESERVLSFYQSFTVPERVLLDVTIERTEQSILKDRWIRTWVKRYALMKSMEVLSQIRGKYATLPGAGGGVSLNATDLITKATEMKEELDMEIEDYIANDPEDIGMHSSFIMG